MMKGLTIRQPYAQLLAIGAKRYETRPMPTKYRGPVAIHAGVTLKTMKALNCFNIDYTNKHALLIQNGTHFWPQCVQAFHERGYSMDMYRERYDFFPTGAIIAYADIVGCYPVEDIKNLTDRERLFGDWSEGRYAWEIAHVVMLSEPLPYKGQLGLWNVPSGVIKAMVEMQEAAHS